jgi:hypothetical protein
MNGWLSPEGIQAISNYIGKIIILIYLIVLQCKYFFQKIIDVFFISENELEALSFGHVVKNRGYNIEFFKKGFELDNGKIL